MKLQAQIVVIQPVDSVARFFEDPANLAMWDRSVAKVVVTSPDPMRVGLTFDTISPAGVKSSYQIIEYVPGKEGKALLTNSNIFRSALWHQVLTKVEEGTEVKISVEFRLKARYFFLVPILLYVSRSALSTDLEYLRRALNECA